jgi:hypothetical protein
MHTFFKLILTVLLGSVIIAQEFDPETGEMIKIQYDPITGEIIKEVQYDPETGELIKSDKETVEKTVLILLKSGDSITGIIESETDTEITLLSNTLGRLMLDKVNVRSIQPFSGVSVSILPGQKSAIKSLSTAAGFTNADLNTYLIQNYGQTLDGLSHTQGSSAINQFQAGSASKPVGVRNNQATYNNAGSATQLNACHQAGLDAVASTSPLWYGGGIMYIVGVPAYILSKPQPNVLALSKIASEEQLLYMECYKTAAQKEQGKRMALGCAGFLLFFMMTAGM